MFNNQWASEKEELFDSFLWVDAPCLGVSETLRGSPSWHHRTGESY